MLNRKQLNSCRLLTEMIQCLHAACVGPGCGASEQVPAMKREFLVGHQSAKLLDLVKGSMFEPEYVASDLSIINWGFPRHIKRLGDQLGADTAALMLEFYERVPKSLCSQLEWHPSEEFRALAQRGHAAPGTTQV